MNKKTIYKTLLFSTILGGSTLLFPNYVEAKDITNLTTIKTTHSNSIENQIIKLNKVVTLNIHDKENMESILFDKIKEDIFTQKEFLKVPMKLPAKDKVSTVIGGSSYSLDIFKVSIGAIDKSTKQSQNILVSIKPNDVTGALSLETTQIKELTYEIRVQLVNTVAPTIATSTDYVTVYKGSSMNADTFGARGVSSEGKAVSVILEPVSTDTTGTFTTNLMAIDEDKNVAKKEVSVKVIEKKVYSSSYGYIESGGDFASINASHRARINGGEYGNCTWYVYNRLSQLGAPIPYSTMGNANQWSSRARAYGYSVNKEAKAGKVAVSYGGQYGHVAFVERVYEDGSILVSEMNVNGLGVISKRTFSPQKASTFDYIDFGL